MPSDSSIWKTLWNPWFQARNWQGHRFQEDCAELYFKGKSGLLNAPTGSGKTFALALPALIDAKLRQHKKGLFLLWITPLKALSKDIRSAIDDAAQELDLNFTVALRTGDTSPAERQKIKTQGVQVLITTPESLHLLIASPSASDFFKHLECVVCDEWHELIGSKRGVQVELALAYLRRLRPSLKTWAISATIGNLEEANRVFLGPGRKGVQVKADIQKEIQVHTIMPDTIDRFPWSGHMGTALLTKVIPLIEEAKTTLIFTNTRNQSEVWYQQLLDANPSLAGRMALHHGSLTREVRDWVENSLHEGSLKAVVCTSSLDLGVDFRPVDRVIQIGSPKGVARFLQRAGRSGHGPGEVSDIHFLPTHSLELLEAAALKQAVSEQRIESRVPVLRAMDVLMQYLMTLAVGEGLQPDWAFAEIQCTHAFASVTREEFDDMIRSLELGAPSLEAYDEYKKITWVEDRYKVISRKLAMVHRQSIGTIAADQTLWVKLQGGSTLGSMEEYFLSKLKEGDAFVFAGRVLEFVRIDGNTAVVRKSKKKKAVVPSWMGGRMSLSSELSSVLQSKLESWKEAVDPEVKLLHPLFEIQQERSAVPSSEELLIELFESREGHHLFVFPFEGRMVNEGMGMLLAYRLSQISAQTYSIAMNDYGFELLSSEPIPLEEALELDLFSTQNLTRDLQESTNYSLMCQRRFADIAVIGGLLFKGTQNKPVKNRHLQSSSRLMYQVFSDFEPHNVLLQQAREEVLSNQLEERRLRLALNKADAQKWIIQRPQRPTPFSFPLMVDRLRETWSSEKIEDRIARMLNEAEG